MPKPSSSNHNPYKTLSSYTKSVNSKENPSNVNDVLVTEIISTEQKSSLLKQNILVVNFIYADWCGPCSLIKPEYHKMFTKYNSTNVIAITKENVDRNLTPTIQVVPTFQYFLNGTLHSVVTGADIKEIEGHTIKLLKVLNGEIKETEVEKKNTEEIPDMTVPDESS
jgi:thioredoxin 1